MRSLSAMTKDTKRYCRIQIGYFLKKLCKRFTTEELARFVPGDDEVTHRRLKRYVNKCVVIRVKSKMKRRKPKAPTRNWLQIWSKRATRKLRSKWLWYYDFNESLFNSRFSRIDDILADSDSDFPEDMETEDGVATAKLGKTKSSQSPSNRAALIFVRMPTKLLIWQISSPLAMFWVSQIYNFKLICLV